MANITTYLANKLLDHATGKAAYTMPTTTYVALYKASPTIAGTQTNEVGTGAASYARVALGPTVANAGAAENTNQLTWTQAGTGETWGTVTHWAVLDALTTGNMLFFGELDPDMAITAGMQYIIAAGALDLSIVLT